MAVVDLLDLKLALGLDASITTDDYELQRSLWAAEAAYARHVGPLPGTYTRTLRLPAFLPSGTTSASVAGVTTTFDAYTGILTTSGYLSAAVEVTYTVGPIAEDHEAAIIADVAEYWDRTQRAGGSAGRPGYATPGGEAPAGGRPVTMYPRIMSLAVGSFA